jgi:hypothetical protein
MQRAVNTIEEEVFSVWLAYIRCWTTDVFFVGPRRDYISSPVVNQKSVIGQEREWSESSAVNEEGFGWTLILSYCNWLCLREIVQEDVNKSNHPVHNPLLLLTEPWTLENIYFLCKKSNILAEWCICICFHLLPIRVEELKSEIS